MTPEQKKPYDLLAEKDKQRYICMVHGPKAALAIHLRTACDESGIAGQPDKDRCVGQGASCFQEKVELSWEGFILCL